MISYYLKGVILVEDMQYFSWENVLCQTIFPALSEFLVRR